MFGDSKDSSVDDFAAQFSQATTMSYTTRMYGFAGCFCIGSLLTFMSVFAVTEIKTHPEKFAVLYSLGNIIVLCSSCFLWGCMAQIKGMIDPVRVGATFVYFLSIILTCYFAFSGGSIALILTFIVIQMLAGIYYSLTYIPYGRTMLKSVLGSMCGL